VAVYTIGHSRHRIEDFIELLTGYGVETVIDTRGQPYSRFNPQFNREPFEASIVEHGLAYVWRGDYLSGRPGERRFYGADGKVQWERVRRWPAFVKAIDEIAERARGEMLALTCAEEDPRRCHRRFLLTPPLLSRDIEVRHIRGDGRMELESAIREAEDSGQLNLFD
jgi:uncharacterized protein (DUF488 family)